MNTLGKRWQEFVDVVFDPWALVLFLAIVILIVYSANKKPDDLTAALLYVVISLSSAVLGGRVMQQWAATNDEGILKARGRHSIRSLTLLLKNVAALERRISLFRAAENHILKQPEVTKRNYEETLATCIQLEEQVVSSIENWRDILPEANINTQIGVISDLRDALETTKRELATTKTTLETEQGNAGAQRSFLLNKMSQLQAQVEQQTRELREKTAGLGGALSFLGLGGDSRKLSDLLLIGDSAGPLTLRTGVKSPSSGVVFGSQEPQVTIQPPTTKPPDKQR